MFASLLHWYADHAAATVAVIFPLCVIIEMLHDRRTGRRDEGRGASLVSAAAFLVVKTIVGRLLFVGLAVWVFEHHRLATMDTGSPMVWLAVFVVRDFVYYWVHRLEHSAPLMWASHQIHHSPQTIGISTTVRVPWMEALYKPWFSLWLPLIGFDPVLAIAFDAAAATISLAQHTTKRARRTWLDRVVVTPAIHRVHHGSNPQYIDRNFGAVLSIWDHAFGTYEPETVPVVYGIGRRRLDTPAEVLTGGYADVIASWRAGRVTARTARNFGR